MTKIPRNNKIEKNYKISKNRFRELYYYALQYQEWKDELKYKYDTSTAITISDMPSAHNGGVNTTEEIAMKCVELSHKIESVESAARLADPELYKYILKAVTTESINYKYLSTVMDIPCSANTFYKKRRKFYWHLSNILEKK